MHLGVSFLPKVLSLLTNTGLGLDLVTHQHALLLAGNLFAGAAIQCMRAALGADGTPTVDTIR